MGLDAGNCWISAAGPKNHLESGPQGGYIRRPDGEVPEWSIGTVSKTVVPAMVPWVRIPPSPPTLSKPLQRLTSRLSRVVGVHKTPQPETTARQMARHVRNVKGGRIWRRRLPVALARRLGRAEITRRLPPTDRVGAEHAARRLDLVLDHLLMAATSHPSRDRAELERLAKEWLRAELEAIERDLAGMAFKSEKAHVDAIAASAERAHVAGTMVRDGDYPVALETARHIFREAGMRGGKVTEKAMAMLVLRGWAELHRVKHERVAAFVPPNGYGGFRHDPLFSEVVPRPDPVAGLPSPAPAPSSKAQKFSVALAEFIAGAGVRSKTANQNASTYARFVQRLGDRPIDQYRTADIADFVKGYLRFPHDHHKAPAYRKMDFETVIAEADRLGARRITPATMGRNLSAISSLFGWLITQGRLETNPCAGVFRVKKTRRARDARPAWTVGDLNELFRSPAWTGYASDAKRYLPGPRLDRDWFFWMPPVLLFTGMRLAEAAGLLLDNVKVEDGVTFFDVREREGRTLKALASARRVPIHPELVALGFLDYAAGLRKKGESQLFPDLRPGGAHGAWSEIPSKRINRYLEKIGMKHGGRRLDNHGFRHTFKTAAIRSGASSALLNEIVGHEHPGEDETYYKGETVMALAEVVASISFPGLDLTHLRPGAAKRV
jgi:integrase